MTAQPATKVSVSSTTAHLSWWLFPSGFRFWQSWLLGGGDKQPHCFLREKIECGRLSDWRGCIIYTGNDAGMKVVWF
jgi:hypothetical protein